MAVPLIRSALMLLLVGTVTTAGSAGNESGIYKCVVDEQVSYQSTPCAGAPEATPAVPSASKAMPARAAGSGRSTQAMRLEADARRAAESKRREEIERGFREANAVDPTPASRTIQQALNPTPPAGFVKLPESVAVDRMTTYTTAIGRGLACGALGASEASRRVGVWMEAQGLRAYTVVAAAGIKFAFDQQREGKSPDSCDAVKASLATFPWP